MFLGFIICLAFADSETDQNSIEINFDEIDIVGEVIKPQGALIAERNVVKFNPLIELRMDWDNEMTRSVLEIK